MKNHFLLSILLYFFSANLPAQELTFSTQPETGPGGSDYPYAEVLVHDFAAEPDGYWLYEPAQPAPELAGVVVFIHGYGAINPMIYGKWIEHLVRKGNIVIFPRYQKNILSPKPSKFAGNVATAIKDAMVELDSGQHVKPSWEDMALVGHSYGGVVSAFLSVYYDSLEIPKPTAALLCSPGTGPLKGGRLESYDEMPEDLKLLIMVSANDHIVGDEFGVKVFETATSVKQRNLLRQKSDYQSEYRITAGHNESYSLDETYDSGLINVSVKRAYHKSKLDPVDYFGYWKLFDALLECSRTGKNCHYAFGDTPEQKYMGSWSDGTPVEALEVLLPESLESKRQALNLEEEVKEESIEKDAQPEN